MGVCDHLHAAISPEAISGLKYCYNVGEEVSLVISQTQSDTTSLTLTCHEFGNNTVTYFNSPNDGQNAVMTPGPPYYYNITLFSVSPIKVNVSVIFKTELNGSTITYSETNDASRPPKMTGIVSLMLCCKYNCLCVHITMGCGYESFFHRHCFCTDKILLQCKMYSHICANCTNI